jgi:transposase-like protein
MSEKRRHFSPEQKAELLRRHILEKVPVSDLCNEQKLQPSVFYHWLKQLCENAPAALMAPKVSSQERKLEEKVTALEEKLKKKDEVIAEISEEFVRAKKELGES